MGSILPKDTIDNHSFLAEELLIPNAQKSDAGRLKMLTDHQGQLVTITNAEPPKVFSGFENQIGKYSSGYKQPKENYEVIKIIELNVNHKFIIIKTESGQYDVIVYKAVENLTEYFGHSNTLHEDVKEGAKIDIEETPYVYKNGMYDENMNLQYGRNLKALFIPYRGLTYEDAIVISDEIAASMTHDEVKDFYLVLNKNDILLNLLGKNGEYKPIPEINEYIQNHILVSRRRIDYNTLLYNFKSDEFTTPQRDDSSIFATGQLKDIFIYSNVLEDTPVNQPFKKILKQQFETFVDLHAHLEDIKLKHNDKVSENFNYWFQYAKDYISPDKDNVLPYTYDNRSFEGIVIKFTVSVQVPCEIGSKLTGR